MEAKCCGVWPPAFFETLEDSFTHGLKVPRFPEPLTAADIPALMERHAVAYHSLREINWREDYPYCPDIQFTVAHSDTSVLLHFRVCEHGTSAATTQDHGPVWNDSCVEFFVMPDVEDGTYFNVECNCIGALHLAEGKDRHGRQYAPMEIMDRVKRWASLSPQKTPGEPLPEFQTECSWEVALVVPAVCLHCQTGLSGRRMKANFYKCGGSGPWEHYLSWMPIRTEKPDFHRPEYFMDLCFE